MSEYEDNERKIQKYLSRELRSFVLVWKLTKRKKGIIDDIEKTLNDLIEIINYSKIKKFFKQKQISLKKQLISNKIRKLSDKLLRQTRRQEKLILRSIALSDKEYELQKQKRFSEMLAYLRNFNDVLENQEN